MKRALLCAAVLICLSFPVIPAAAPVLGGAQAMPPHPRLADAIARGDVVPPAARPGLDGAGRTPRSITGSINALAVVVDFSDKVKTVTASYFDTLIFAAPVGGRGSVRDYFSEVSYATVDIVTVNLPSSIGWKRAPQTYAYYVYGAKCTDAPYPHNCQKLAEDIVDAVNGVVNFANYDNDGDGYAEPIMLIHAGPGAELTRNPNDIWSHSWVLDSPRNYDGVTIRDYVIMPEYWEDVSPSSSDMTIGVFAHEMGHGFWGLPDVYDRDNSSAGAGNWSLMAGGSWNGPNSGGWGTDGSSPAWPDAWSRTQMGFVTATPISSNVTGRSIPRAYGNPPPAETVLKLRSGVLGAQEYFLLENRQQVSGSYDEYLPGNGLLVWHADEAMNVYSKQNDYECTSTPHCQCDDNYHYLLALEQADGLSDLEWGNDWGDTGDPFPGVTSNRTWTMSTDPESSSWYGGPTCTNTCIGATNVSNSSATMTADLQVSCGGPADEWLYLPLATRNYPPVPGAPTLYDISNGDGDGNYTVSWSTVSLADYYTLQEDDNSSFTSPTTRYSGSSTSYSVSGQANGTWYYRVQGCNGYGCGAWSNTKSTVVSPGGWQTIVSTDFEGTFPGSWQVFDNGYYSGEYYWAKRNCRAFGGSYSGWAVGGGAQGGSLGCFSSYPDYAEAWMIYGPFSLVGASDAEMTFQLWLDVEYGYDYGYWGASTNLSQPFYGIWATGDSGGWLAESFDLTDVPTLGDLRGEPEVWVALVLESDSSVHYAEGFYVDNIVLHKYVGAEGLPGSEPVPDLPPGMKVKEGSLSLTEGELPTRHTLTLDNQTGSRACLEVQGSGLGWACYSPGRALYGGFPAGTYDYCVQACRAEACRSASFPSGDWDLDARCTGQGALDISFMRVVD